MLFRVKPGMSSTSVLNKVTIEKCLDGDEIIPEFLLENQLGVNVDGADRSLVVECQAKTVPVVGSEEILNTRGSGQDRTGWLPDNFFLTSVLTPSPTGLTCWLWVFTKSLTFCFSSKVQ